MMKSKKRSRIKCYDTTVVLKKSILIITKSDSTGLSKLLWQKKGKTTKKRLGNGQEMSLSYLQKFLLIRKKNLLYFRRN